MARVFISYSHKDEDLRDRLETHLAMLKRQGAIEVWHDRRIVAGDEFAGSIDRELERADLILLLVSPDFLASNYCYDIEMRRAVERHERKEARVIPVILRACDWHSAPFGQLLAAPKDGKPVQSWPDLDEAFLDVVTMIRAGLPQAEPHSIMPPLSQVPVIGAGPRSSNLRLRKTYTEADRDRFVDEAFTYMGRFFANSLEELKARNTDIEVSFRSIDANRFTAVVYRNGKAISRCKIMLGGMFGRGITFSYNDQAPDNSMNESLSVEADEQGLHLRPMGMARLGMERDPHFTFEGASEYYWSMFIGPLQP